MPDLYDSDFYAWTKEQAQALAAGHLGELDLKNLAEEIESLGKSDRRGLQGALEIVLLHLLKWRYQPERQSESWDDSLTEHRRLVALIAEDSPSLRRQIPELMLRGYGRARRAAARQTRLHPATFPDTCPWMPEQVLDDEFFPGRTP